MDEESKRILTIHQCAFNDAVDMLFEYVYFLGKDDALELLCAENSEKMKDYPYITYFKKEFSMGCDAKDLHEKMDGATGLRKPLTEEELKKFIQNLRDNPSSDY